HAGTRCFVLLFSVIVYVGLCTVGTKAQPCQRAAFESCKLCQTETRSASKNSWFTSLLSLRSRGSHDQSSKVRTRNERHRIHNSLRMQIRRSSRRSCRIELLPLLVFPFNYFEVTAKRETLCFGERAYDRESQIGKLDKALDE